MTTLLLLAGVAGVWFLAIVLIWLIVAGGTRTLSREETERLRTAAQEALHQLEARRGTLYIIKHDNETPSVMVSKN